MIDKFVEQLTPPKMESISGMDATFLYGETDTSPMHVGSVAIIEGSLKFDTFKKVIASKIHQMPRLRQRLMEIPFKVDYPYWVDDPNFNLDMHIHRMALPKPGGWKELRAMASKIFSHHLDRSRPLWSFTFVEGIDSIAQVPKGSVAVISKIHHVAIDGMAGAGMMSLIFEMSPTPAKLQEPRIWKPKPLPNEIGLMTRSAMSFTKSPFKLAKIAKDAAMGTIKAGFLTRAQHIDLPTAPFSAPKTTLNGIISAQRKWNSAILDLERVKHLRKVMGTTLNDVVLAICAGALRNHLEEHKNLPIKPLVAMVPVSVRAKSDASAQGNKISAMLVQLATDVSDPIERLEMIHENALRGKTYQGAMGAKTLSNLAEAIPFGVANQAARMYSRYNIAKMHNPVFNVVITNVPGPNIPLYLQGHKLQSIMGMAPIIDGMGMIITVLSYNGQITISPTSCVNSMPTMDNFTKSILDSANELEAAILELEKSAIKKTKSKASAKPQSDKLFNHLKKYLKENPELIKSDLGKFQFKITGPIPGEWKVDLTKAPGKITRGVIEDADATFTIRDKYLMRIAKGELDVASAFVQGRLAIKGNSDKAMKVGKILAGMPALD